MTYIPEYGHRRWAEEGTTHLGAPGLPGTPRWVVPTWWPRRQSPDTIKSHISRKKSGKKNYRVSRDGAAA